MQKTVCQVLLNDDEDLSNFRSQSVKKKPVENKTVSTCWGCTVTEMKRYVYVESYCTNDASPFAVVLYKGPFN